MGESKIDRTVRLSAAVTAGLAVTALLSSCAGLTGGPGSAGPSEAATPSVTATEAAATSAPTEAATESPTPEPTATEAAAKKEVVPFITSATWDAKAGAIDVGAIVPVVVERAGTCTLTAVNGGTTLSTTGDAVATASYTGCPQLVLGGGRVTPGTWSVTVTYDSDDSAGTSTARTVTAG